MDRIHGELGAIGWSRVAVGCVEGAIGCGSRLRRQLRKAIGEPLQESRFVGIGALHMDIAAVSPGNATPKLDLLQRAMCPAARPATPALRFHDIGPYHTQATRERRGAMGDRELFIGVLVQIRAAKRDDQLSEFEIGGGRGIARRQGMVRRGLKG